ncbi:putative ankyrin repeat protein L25 [Zancudomyces culisetae]|uniref:Putative ankyrin repeat protein L25 n=1 Tax=Zancudomyces culisetae TaxID=1213189 RepID=A0A1R1PD67_ZANCU|nr:putative ankyrin repeat protein L25 [Zancudomyces culisetae]|eukprot:OMH78812.1 putative ankyrin repeat protein L25 [Zancudomyces culisetae]
MNEKVGGLVLRKIKNLDYEIALEIAIKYKWRNIINKLLKMYVVIGRSNSMVMHKGTLFINEGEYLDIDIEKLFSENESQREITEIEVYDSLYIRPLFRMGDVLANSIRDNFGLTWKSGIEILIDICNTRFEFPPDICSSTGRDIICVDEKFLLYCILEAACEICRLGDLEWLKRILDLKISFNDPSDTLCWIILEEMDPVGDGFHSFISEYEETEKKELLFYMLLAYLSIKWDIESFISYLEINYSKGRHAQILFDSAIYNEHEILVKKYFFKVELNSENIRKITEMAYKSGSVDLIRFILNNSDKLKGELDENTLKTAIKKKEYELTQDIISKYPNAISISCLEEAVSTGDIRTTKLVIETGVNLKAPEFNGIRIASENRDMDMLQLLLENDVSVGSVGKNVIVKLCSIKNHKIAKRLLEFFEIEKGKAKVKSETSKTEVKSEKKLKFSKTMLCLIEVILCFYQNELINSLENDHHDYENYENVDGVDDNGGGGNYFYFDCHVDFDDFLMHMDLYERVVSTISSKKKDITNTCALYFGNPNDTFECDAIQRDCYDKLLELINYISKKNLQRTFDDTEYDETNGLRNENNIEVLNDRHYELAKLELINRNFGMLKMLIEYGLDVNSHDSLILKTAYKAGDIDWIDYFISKGAKLKGRSDGFEEACKSDKVEVLEHWIKNGGVIPKNSRYECINMACLLGNFDMVKLLVENGVDLSDPTRNGVRIACRLGLKRTLKYLLDNNAVVEGVGDHQL